MVEVGKTESQNKKISLGNRIKEIVKSVLKIRKEVKIYDSKLNSIAEDILELKNENKILSENLFELKQKNIKLNDSINAEKDKLE